MNNRRTPKPGTAGYKVEKTETLNTPEYHSSTDQRDSNELPATENLNDNPDGKTKHQDIPKTNLGNKRDRNENQREKIITRK